MKPSGVWQKPTKARVTQLVQRRNMKRNLLKRLPYPVYVYMPMLPTATILIASGGGVHRYP